MSWRRLEDVLKTFLQDVLKTSWKRLEDVLKTYSQDEYIGLDQDVLKTSSEDVKLRRTYSSWSRRLEDVFWRRKAKANIFVLIKTSSEDEDETRLQDVFIKTNVCWVFIIFANVVAWFAAVLDIAKLADKVRMKLISQLINGILRVLQKLFKYFNGTITLNFFVPSFPFEPVIFCLNLNESLLPGKLVIT